MSSDHLQGGSGWIDQPVPIQRPRGCLLERSRLGLKMLKQIDPVVEGLDLPLELLAPSFESLQIVGRGFEMSDAALKPREDAGRWAAA